MALNFASFFIAPARFIMIPDPTLPVFPLQVNLPKHAHPVVEFRLVEIPRVPQEAAR